ncbi:MAG: hypothetical protein ACOVP4_11640 [Bacteriovoracaceae bacterium]
MKTFIILSSLILSSSVWAQCANKIDNSKVMLFVDSNESGPEILTAQKAACQRGQKLVVIPQNYKDYEVYRLKQEKLMAASLTCSQKNPNNFESACKSHMDALHDSFTEVQNFKQKQKSYDTQIIEEMDKLKKINGTLESFTISGHDGGGQFGGSNSGKQNYSKQQVAEIMRSYPEVNKVKSLMLLGCYTGVQQEMFDWQTIFPDVRLIGGYDGSAPLSIRPQGHDYLYDLLTKEKTLTTIADEKKLELMVKGNIKSINQLNAAILLKPQCENIHAEKSYYYSKQGNEKVFRPINIDECLAVKNELLLLKQRLDKYDSGEIEPPLDTVEGELRQIYNQSRTHEHCAEMIGPILDSNKVFGLLFYDGEKKNFAHYFDEQMREAEKIIENLTSEKIIKSTEEHFKLQEDFINRDKDDLKLLETDPAKYVAQKEKELETDKTDYERLTQDPRMKTILEMFPYLKSWDEDLGSGSSSVISNQIMSEEDNKLYIEITNKRYAIIGKQFDIENFKQAPSQMIEMKKSILQQSESDLSATKFLVKKITSSPDYLRNIWIPTKKNLEGKSRKETLENLHKMHQVLSTPGLPVKERAALSWTAERIGTHLQGLMNPFSWHEFTGVTESPPFNYKLSDAIKDIQPVGFVGGGGMSGGYGYGGYGGMSGGYGYGGGGYVGGAASGSSGGGGMSDSGRPIY